MPTTQHHLETATNIIQIVSDPRAVVATVSSAVSFPWWWPIAKETSEVAAVILPILGVTLASMQIAALMIKGLMALFRLHDNE